MGLDILSGRYNANPRLVNSAAVRADRTIEAHSFRNDIAKSQNRLMIAATSPFKRDIDISWLPVAAETYQISSDIKDYVIVDVPAVTIDIPNRNLQAFPFEEVSYFDPMYGRQVFQSFIGKPSHVDHQNKDPLKAKGVIFDATMQFVPKWNVWKIRLLQGFDRSKDNMLASQILNGQRCGYSMGALVSNFICSVCGTIENQYSPCAHIKAGKGSVFNDRLTYEICCGVNYVENSSVAEPADPTAESDSYWS